MRYTILTYELDRMCMVDACHYKVVIISSSCSVSENMPLYDILNEFQKGHSHIAVVYKDLNSKSEAPKKVKDGEQHDLRDNYKNKGENAPLDKGRD